MKGRRGDAPLSSQRSQDSSVDISHSCNSRSEKRALYYKELLTPHLQESGINGLTNGNGELVEGDSSNNVQSRASTPVSSGQRTTIEEVEDEDFRPLSPIRVPAAEKGKPSVPSVRASYDARGGTEVPIKKPTSEANSVELVVERQEGEKDFSPAVPSEKPKPFSALWVLSRLKNLAAEAGIGILRTWVHKHKQAEATSEKIKELLQMTTFEALDELEDLHRGKQFIFRKNNHASERELLIDADITNLTTGEQYRRPALIDSGCTGSCINQRFVDECNLPMQRYEFSTKAYNTDGTENSNGKITHFVEVRLVINGHAEIRQLAVTNLGRTDVFLGHDWLFEHNPTINWSTGTLVFDNCPSTCENRKLSPEEDDYQYEEGDRLWVKFSKPNRRIRRMDMFIRAHETMANKLAAAANQTKKAKEVPEQYKGFEDVFGKEEFDTMPPKQPWDHAIELKLGSEPSGCKIYPLNV